MINPYLYHYDSAYFQSVGKLWLSGTIPYRDFFDNKGPLLFLINAMAYIFPFPRLVLLLVESILLAAAFLLMHDSFARLMILSLFVLHLSGCAGDLYGIWLFLSRFRDPSVLRQDTGPAMIYYSRD